MSTDKIVEAHFRDHTEFYLGDSTGRVTKNREYWIGRVDGVWLLNSTSRLLTEKSVQEELTRQAAERKAKNSPRKMWAIRHVGSDVLVAYVAGVYSADHIVLLMNEHEGVDYVYRSAEKEEV